MPLGKPGKAAHPRPVGQTREPGYRPCRYREAAGGGCRESHLSFPVGFNLFYRERWVCGDESRIIMKKYLIAAVIGSLSVCAYADDTTQYQLDDIVVTATRIPTPDTLAPYASEIHTRRDIEQSGATTLYDYLAQDTSVNVMPNYGNRDTPQIDMRGYGISNGYQNIVVTVDGRRLNNIDGMPQLLGSIPLADIDRIEITKGSGSVMFGDGATAGTIQIYTRNHTGASIEASLGNHGGRDLTATAGLQKEKLSLNASAQYSGLDGTSVPDPTGNTDSSSNRTWSGNLELRPVDHLKISLDGSSSRIDSRYSNYLTLDQFNANPAQLGTNNWAYPTNSFTHELLDSGQWGLGFTADLTSHLKLTAKHTNENLVSNNVTFDYEYNYDKTSNDLTLIYRNDHFDLTTGMQTFDGTRIGSSDSTSKKNTGWYVQSQYHLGDTTLSAGARTEKVDYCYTPTVGAALAADHNLYAWDFGVNQHLDDHLSLFANYDRAFQAPDIDRFFNFGTFNGFIVPAISHTLNLGLNQVTAANRLKLTLFHANLNHEIYYYDTGSFLTSYNTNLDKSHKYGLELQDTWKATDTLTASLNYAYTRAIIDQAEQNSAYDGKDLPGVPHNSVTLGLGWQATSASHLQLTQSWRSETYAADDFANDFTQKQAAYLSTDLAYRYTHGKFEYFATVENLFEHKNALWISDDVIYPVNFTRTWRLGMTAKF
jgi:iron complex outermembrane receptor protein